MSPTYDLPRRLLLTDCRTLLRLCGGVVFALAWLVLSAVPAQAATYALGTTTLLVGPAQGTNSVVLAVTPQSGAWSATPNASWLHLSAPNQSGTGSTNVIFTYDANSGATRSGTLTIGGIALTVTQAGLSYVAAQPLVTLVSTGGEFSYSGAGVAVDNSGNVFFSDPNSQRIDDWTASNDAVSEPVTSGLFTPLGVAVDGAGNIYIADENHNAIKEWTAAGHTLITLVSSNASTPLYHPAGVAVDLAGNVYIADTGDQAVKEWTAANSNVTTLVSTGLSYPTGVAVDAAGNVYIGDSQHSAVKEWLVVNSNVTTLVSTGLETPEDVAVDGAGNVYIADVNAGILTEWSAASKSLTQLTINVAPNGVAVDAAGNVYIANIADNNVLQELPRAFVNTTPMSETVAAGSDVLPAVVPATANLLPPFAPTSDQSWLTITGVANGVVSFSFASNASFFSRTAHINVLGQTIAVTQTNTAFALGTTGLLEGAPAGSDSVVLASASRTAGWTNTANASWLHLSAPNQNGAGSTNIIFTFDANAGAIRSGTLTIAGLTLTVTQAGSTYVQASLVTNLVYYAAANTPGGVGVDSSGNVFSSDIDAGTPLLLEWAATNSSINFVLESGLQNPEGLAVDSAGNVYIADIGNSAIKKWTAATSNLTTLVSSGLDQPYGVAVDSVGNLYIADTMHNAVQEWTLANNTLTPLVSSNLSGPYGVAVDAAGNVYIADTGNSMVKKWTAAYSNVTVLVSNGLSNPKGVAVDGAGNVYIADTGNSATRKWSAASNSLSTLSFTGSYQPLDVAVDGNGDVYIVNSGGNSPIEEMSRAFVDPTPKFEPATAGNDVLPVVVPATANLLGIFTPTSDQPWWLSVTGSSNGVVRFSFAANPGPAPSRTAHINVLGQSIPVTQAGVPYALAASTLLEGPSSGSDSALLAVWPITAAWTNTANASWLHLSPPNQSGAGSTNIVFTYDANSGATRSGTLTLAGIALTVTQAGSTYVPAQPLTTLVSGLNSPQGVAVDGAGNVYIADTGNFAVEEWTRASNTLTTLVSSSSPPFNSLGSPGPISVAVDGLGNVYFADTNYVSIDQWSPVSNTVIILTDSQIANVSFIPYGVAVDVAGNLYISDTNYNAIEEWSPSNGAVNTLISSGISQPFGVAVDLALNLYIADTSNQVMDEWTPASQTLVDLAPSGLSAPSGVAVDNGGNVYVADYANQALFKWSPVNDYLAEFYSGSYIPYAVAVDAARNVYFADTNNGVIEELPYAFVDPTSKSESGTAGSDVLPGVLPSTANLLPPFAPTSDQSWLTIGGITNGAVSFSFTANTGSSRTANITLLGQTISVTQSVAAAATPPVLTNLQTLGKGIFQFAFTNNPSATFTVLSATNLSLPLSNWTIVGAATNISSDLFQFTSQPTTNDPARFYRVRSP